MSAPARNRTNLAARGRDIPFLCFGLGIWACACSSQEPPPACVITEQISLPGSPLTLLPDARLDRVGDGFLLIGLSGDTVRWMPIDRTGRAGAEASTTVPAGVTGPWFGAAGTMAPGDRVVIAYGRPGGAAGQVELQAFSVAAADGGGATALTKLADLPDPGPKPLQLVMGSSETGMRAVLAWAARGPGEIRALVLDGAGKPVGPTIMLTAVEDFDCLALVAARTEIGISFYQQSEVADRPDWRLFELRDMGFVDFHLRLALDSKSPSCPSVTPTSEGHALAWQNDVGTWLTVYDSKSNQFRVDPLVGALHWGGVESQPPLGGLGAHGNDNWILLERPRGPEVWRFDAFADRQGDALVLASQDGKVGRVSSRPVAGSLYATYADYLGGPPGAGGLGGRRHLVRVECPP